MNLTSSTVLPLSVLLIVLAVWVYAIVDFARTDERDLRIFTREVWLVILILGSVAGAVVWLTLGRPRRH